MRNISLAFTRWAFAFSSALQRIPAPITWFAFLLTAGALLALRRPDELLNPYVWAEDGVVNIRDFIDYGARSIFHTVAGYFVLATKLISVTALSISFKHYPVIANWLSFSFELAVLCCIWKAPTNLAGKALCAFMVLLHPNGGENYIVPLTAFWHATLLVPLALLWKKEADHLRHRWIRSIFIVLGGLSSPVIIPLSPLFLWRAYKEGRKEWLFAGLALICAAIQMFAIITYGMAGDKQGPGALVQLLSLIDSNVFIDFINKFIGYAFFYPNQYRPYIIYLTLSILAILIISISLRLKQLSQTFWLLLCMFFSSVALSVVRVSVSIIDPYLAGPRYFFYPYIFLYWVVIYLIVYSRFFFSVILSLLLAQGIYTTASLPYIRSIDRFVWKDYVEQCKASTFSEFVFPIHTSGSSKDVWTLKVSPDDCRRLH